MSGIVGIYYRSGEPLDLVQIKRLTDMVAFRGPDGHSTWADGPVGLGHAAFHTTFESVRERQPRSLDGKVWITADARIDARNELIGKLGSVGRDGLALATDDELILHAYHVWGNACIEHLLGDFAFAIWDGPERKLFCARDHFGVKPFYYAHVRDCFVFSNSYRPLRLHEGVSDTLDDLTIADSLMFRRNLRQDATGFADIRRLPPAHWAEITKSGLRLHQYWVPSVGEELHLKNPNEYTERFHELLGMAVLDRLRTDRVAVSMSGGLDSTSVAAKALRLLKENGSAYDLAAYNIVLDRLIPDQERYYSDIVAASLGIPIYHLAIDDYRLFDRLDDPELTQSEPYYTPQSARFVDFYRMMSPRFCVALTGWDGDILMKENPYFYLSALWRDRRRMKAVADTLRYYRATGTIPRLGFRTRVKRALGLIVPSPVPPVFPAWIDGDLVQELDLRTRWEEGESKLLALLGQSRRPVASLSIAPENGRLPALLESLEADAERFPVELRHPLLDLRVAEFLLALPAIPWCINKQLLRRANAGILPKEILLRPKTVLRGDPEYSRYREDPIKLNDFDPVPELTKYIDISKVPEGAQSSSEFWTNVQPLMLNYWLSCQRLNV